MNERLAYWAGFIDGEGSIFIKKEKPRRKAKRITPIYELTLKIDNTNKEVIDKFWETFGVGCKTFRQRNGPNGKPLYGTVVKQDKALAILEKIEPYVIVKREHIKLAKEFIRQKQEFHGKKITDEEITKRESFYQRMKELNKRGASTAVEMNKLAGRVLSV